MYLILAALVGALIVMAMVLNKGIVEKIGMNNNIIITFLTASIILLVICCLIGDFELFFPKLKNIPKIYFLGGFIGILTTYLFNVLVFRISIIYIVLLRFIAQMLIGAVLDYFFLNIFSFGKIFGATLFAIGLMLNSRVKKNSKIRA